MSGNRESLERQLSDLLTAQDLVHIFGVTPMTIHLWTALDKDPLPKLTIRGSSRPAVRFIPADVADWAKRNGRTFRAGKRRLVTAP
jgi:hypothetical protein